MPRDLFAPDFKPVFNDQGGQPQAANGQPQADASQQQPTQGRDLFASDFKPVFADASKQQIGIPRDKRAAAGYSPDDVTAGMDASQVLEKGFDYARGAAETGGQALSGLAGTVAGVAKSTYDKLTGEGGEKAAKDLLDTQEALTYEPRTKEGKEISQGIGTMLHPYLKPVQDRLDRAADYIEKDLNSPLAAAHVKNALNELPFLFEAGRLATLGRAGRAGEVATAGETARAAPAHEIPSDLDVPRDTQEQIKQAAKLPAKKQAKQSETLATRYDPDVQKVEAAKRLGIDHELLPSSTAKNQQAIEIERGLASIPASELSEAAKREVTAVAQKADDFIKDFGGTTDKSALSDRLKASLTDTIKELDNKSDVLYDKINQSIPISARVDTTKLKESLNQEADVMKGRKNLEPIEKRILSISEQEGGPSYAQLDKERQKVGMAIRKSDGPYRNSHTGSLKKLYGMLTDAQEATAANHGMADTWQAAKSMTDKRKQLEDNSVKLLGRDLSSAIMPKVGLAVRNLSTGDYKKFDDVMNALPKSERQEVVMTSLDDAFTGGSKKEGQMSLSNFDDWMNGLNRNKAAKNRLYKNMPEGAPERMEDLHLVAKGVREAREKGISTGRLKNLTDDFDTKDGVLSRIYGLGKKGALIYIATHFGDWATIMATAKSTASEVLSMNSRVPLTKAADKMLASPEFRKAIVDYAGATSEAKRAAIERTISRNGAVKNWLREVGRSSVKAGSSDKAKAITRAGVMNYLTQPSNKGSDS